METEHKLSDYNFEFPKELIASRTAGKGKTRILHCPKDGGERHIMKAPEIVDLFRPGDCLVVNNTKVIPARLYGHTLHGGEVETLLVQALIPAEDGSARYEAQVRPGKAFKVGRELDIAGVKTVVEDIKEDGARVLRFAVTPVELEAVMNREGHVPLPPYIDRPDDESDKLAYQTIFAKYSGAVAAPTASLHFSEEMLDALKAKGVYVAEVTLHVGPGTFQNISVEDFTQHKMHGEHYELTKENAEIINKAKREGGRVVTVGTTSTQHSRGGNHCRCKWNREGPEGCDSRLLLPGLSLQDCRWSAHQFPLAQKFAYLAGVCLLRTRKYSRSL